MGFTIETYSLYGLPPLPNIYCSIKGSYSVKKDRAVKGDYEITFTTYFQASQEDPIITQKDMSFSIQALPNPAVLYKIIYDYVKGQLAQSAGSVGADPHYLSNQQTLSFTDD